MSAIFATNPSNSLPGFPAVAITGRGMVSSLGCRAAIACAAARAGIVRSEALENFQFHSSEDGKLEPAVGHPVPVLTEGFEGPARLLRLIQAGLADLNNSLSEPTSEAETGLYVSLPDKRRIFSGLDLIADETFREILTEEAGAAPESTDNDADLIQTAMESSGWQGRGTVRHIARSGSTGVAEAMGKAVDDLARGRVLRAVVGGADTLLGQETLLWLKNTGRLKSSGLPAGLQPGEAGAFFILEPLNRAPKWAGPVLGTLAGVFLGEVERTLLSGKPSLGRGLAAVIRRAADQAQWRDGDPVWLISDQNGETYRAMEWGYAVVRLRDQSPAFSDPILWYPAASFGDVGAATGAVALSMAVSAFQRGYAPAKTTAVISSATGKARAAILIRAPDGGPAHGVQ